MNPSATHLLDDTQVNITRAMEAGYQATEVPQEGGFRRSLFALMYKFIDDVALNIFHSKY